MSSSKPKFSVGLFMAVALIGAYMAKLHRYEMIYVDLGDERGPAAVQRSFDISDLEGPALSRKINDRLIGEAKILQRENALGLELGQFVTEGPDHHKMLACSVYDRIQLVFRAEGQAINGRSPEMLVEGDCRISTSDIHRMQPIWIPVAEVLKSSTSTQELSFFDDEPVSLKFSFVGDQWPKRWALNSLRLYHRSFPDRQIIVDRDEIRQARPASVLVEF